MSKKCWATLITCIGITAMVGLITIFNNTPLGWFLGIITLLLAIFGDFIVIYGVKALSNKVKINRQKVMMCPRCKILVDIESGICSQCNQKL
ncbi:MAG: hypothetical protein ACFFBP_03955 [Promethearchaeota archaeon]